MAGNSAGSVLVNIFTSPTAAFVAIKEVPRPWLPLLILMVGIFATQFAYMQAVDFPWLMDRQLQAGPGAAQMTEQQRTEAVDTLARVSPSVLGAAQGGSSALAILIIYSLIALYYTGVSFASRDGVKFKQWLALIAWCSLPGLLGMAASFVNLQVTDARFLPPEQLNPLSFGSLLALDPEGATIVQRILMSLDVTVLWATVLQILGYQYFTQKSVVTATIVVLGPLALIVVISALAALF